LMQSELFFDILKGSFYPVSLHLAIERIPPIWRGFDANSDYVLVFKTKT